MRVSRKLPTAKSWSVLLAGYFATTLCVVHAVNVRSFLRTTTSTVSSEHVRAAACQSWCPKQFEAKGTTIVCKGPAFVGKCDGCEKCKELEEETKKPNPCKSWCHGEFTKTSANKVCEFSGCSGCEPCATIPSEPETSEPDIQCKDTPDWKNNHGYGCADYDGKWCTSGGASPGQAWALGPQYNMPEDNCCVCGRQMPQKPKDSGEEIVAEEAHGIGKCESFNPCQNHGICIDGDAEIGAQCTCVGGFTGGYCEEDPIPGAIEIRDAKEATEVAKKAVQALNKMREANEKSKVSIKKVIAYSTQVVAGTLHTLCIRTESHGDIELTWDDFEHGEGPHLSSVVPVRESIKWLSDEPARKFVCVSPPTPYDKRKSADSNSMSLLDMNTSTDSKKTLQTRLLEMKTKATSNLASSMPNSWDARVDHARSSACKDLINAPYDQGTCGSCYAFAAVGTASIRACLAGHDISNAGFSIQDVLNCGTVWDGEFQNNVKTGDEGSRFANNCDGYKAVNVFEFATKYGLVDTKCQKYEHGGDPLTHFDENAGADTCILKNDGRMPVTPEIEVFNHATDDYKAWMFSLRDRLFDLPTKPGLSDLEIQSLKDLNLNYEESTLLWFVENAAAALHAHLDAMIPSATRDRLQWVSLGAEIQPGETIQVSYGQFCKIHPDNSRHMEAVTNKVEGSASCLARLKSNAPTNDKLTVYCKTHSDKKTIISGIKDEIVGGLHIEICECSHDNLKYEKAGSEIHLDQDAAPALSELGAEARGYCHRNRDNGEFDFEGAHKAGCGKVHNIFHSPVKAVGRTLSESLMQKAIMNGGAIAASFKTCDSFMKFDGDGVFDVSPDEHFDGGHAVVLFGWGEEDGKKFWWGKNSWGAGPAAVFKYARGGNTGDIESRGIAWVTADGPGKPSNKEIQIESNNPKGFCPDFLLNKKLLADKEKIEKSCVSAKCVEGAHECHLIFSSDCPTGKEKTTVVDIITDSNVDSVGENRAINILLDAATLCIADIYTEDRS